MTGITEDIMPRTIDCPPSNKLRFQGRGQKKWIASLRNNPFLHVFPEALSHSGHKSFYEPNVWHIPKIPGLLVLP